LYKGHNIVVDVKDIGLKEAVDFIDLFRIEARGGIL
jgi:hypothetical protein